MGIKVKENNSLNTWSSIQIGSCLPVLSTVLGWIPTTVPSLQGLRNLIQSYPCMPSVQDEASCLVSHWSKVTLSFSLFGFSGQRGYWKLAPGQQATSCLLPGPPVKSSSLPPLKMWQQDPGNRLLAGWGLALDSWEASGIFWEPDWAVSSSEPGEEWEGWLAGYSSGPTPSLKLAVLKL